MDSPRRRGARRVTVGPLRILLIASALVGAAIASPGHALGVSTIPAEQVSILDGALDSAIVADVDGDGVRELVRIMPWETNPTQLAVEVLSVADAGAVSRHGFAPLRREAVPDDSETVAGPPADEQNMLPLAPGEPALLLAWQDEGHEHTLVATLGAARLAVPCCLTLWEVELDAAGATSLRLVGLTSLNADAVLVVDLDADGTDELVLTEPDASGHPGEALVHVLRFDGVSFVRDRPALPVAPGTEFVSVGETDGLPGGELAGVGAGPPSLDVPPDVSVDLPADQAVLYRLSMREGQPRMETAEVPFGGAPVGIPGPDGPRLAIVSPGNEGSLLLDWPAGGTAIIEAQSLRRGVPLAVLGSGGLARLVLLRDNDVLDVLDGRLGPSQGLTGSVAAAAFLGSLQPPYVGAVPGGLQDGRPAVIFRGRLAEAPRSTVPANLLATRIVATLPGLTPVGIFGPGGGFMALAGRVGVPTQRRGGSLVFTSPSPQTRLVVAETEVVLSPEADDGDLQPQLLGAVFAGGQPARQVVAAAGPFEIEISAPIGSLATFETANPRLGDGSRAGGAGIAILHVLANDESAGNERFSARVLVATPAGHAYGAAWEVRIQRTPPALEVSATTPLLASRVPVSGSTDPGATVTVDGHAVSVAANGAFTTEVSAGILPRIVEVVASDLVGNSSRTRLSVVAFVDYRQFPWVPIVAAFTLLAALLLFLRAPRPRAMGRATDAGSLEEIE